MRATLDDINDIAEVRRLSNAARTRLLRAVVGDSKAITLTANYTANMAFDRSAIHLLARVPKVPEDGDQAADEFIMIDPDSGLPFRIALYKGYMANQIAIQCAWGVKAVKPEHIAILIG